MKSIFSYLLGSAMLMVINTTTAHAQQEPHYRYFEITSLQLNDSQVKAMETSLLRNEAMRIDQVCMNQNALLVSVNANYPKRIEDITAELQSIGKKSWKTKELPTVSPISAQIKDAWCQ